MHCEARLGREAIRAASCVKPGGANRDRTGDLLLAKQALSQLSYGPVGGNVTTAKTISIRRRVSVGGSGWIRTIDPRLIKTML